MIVLEKIGGIDEMVRMLGPANEAKTIAPNSIRAELSDAANVHTPSSTAQAQQWLSNLFTSGFPLQQTLALIKPDAFGTHYLVYPSLPQACRCTYPMIPWFLLQAMLLRSKKAS